MLLDPEPILSIVVGVVPVAFTLKRRIEFNGVASIKSCDCLVVSCWYQRGRLDYDNSWFMEAEAETKRNGFPAV
jgi:hypothetical protein